MGENGRVLEKVGDALRRHALLALACHDVKDLVDLAGRAGFDDLETGQLPQLCQLLCHLRIDGMVPPRALQAVRVEVDARGAFARVDQPVLRPQRVGHAAIFADHLAQQQGVVRRQRGVEGLADGEEALRVGAGLRVDQRKVIVDHAVVEETEAPHAQSRFGDQRHDHQGRAALCVVDRDVKRRAVTLRRQPVFHRTCEIETEKGRRAAAFLQPRPSLDEAGVVDAVETTGHRQGGMRHRVRLPWRTATGAWRGRTCGRHRRKPPCPRSRRRRWRASAASSRGHGAARRWHS